MRVRLRAAAIAMALVVTALTPSVVWGQEPAPAAAEEPRGWLAQPAPELSLAGREEGPSSWRMALIVVLLGGLGAAAWYARRHQQKKAGLPKVPDLTIVGAARVGNKAQIVLASVAGKLLLVGVTENSVNKLDWIEPDAGPKLQSKAVFDDVLQGLLDEDPQAESLPAPKTIPIHEASQPGDSAVLKRPSVALEIALGTHDSVAPRSDKKAKRRNGPAEELETPGPALEAQARGLARRARGARS